MRPKPIVDTTTVSPPPPTPEGQMPDLRGLSAREALRTLTRIGLTARMSGDGLVIEQSPEPGTMLAGGGETCTLKLGRRPAAASGGTQP